MTKISNKLQSPKSTKTHTSYLVLNFNSQESFFFSQKKKTKIDY